MNDIALSAASHDLVFSDSGDLLLINDAERIAQQIKITLWAFKGEWFLDSRFGVPYLEQIMIKSPNMNHIRAIIRDRILDVPGVTGVKSLTLAIDGKERTLTITHETNTDAGLVTAREVLGYGQ